MANTEKIFVDLNEDIVFILERVRQSLAPKVVLVVPKSANLTSSLVSLKLLTRQISKINKLVVLSTDDEFGIDQANKAELIAVNDTGDITPDIWMDAKKKKEDYIDELERRKRTLLDKRQEKENKEYMVVDDSKEESMVEETVEVDEEDVSEQISAYKKQRIPARLISVGPIKFYAAGDIRQDRTAYEELVPLELKKIPEKIEVQDESDNLDSKKKDKIVFDTENRKSEDEPKVLDDEDLQKESQEDETIDSEQGEDQESKTRYKKRGILAGKNLANAQSSPLKRSQSSFANTQKPSQIKSSKPNELMEKAKTFINNSKNRKFIFAGFGVLLVVMFFSMFSSSSASLIVTVKRDEISVSEEITADPSVEGISISEYKIPATLRNTNDDVSESVNTTGDGTTGDRARGQVDIYNRTTAPITLDAGTELTIDGSGLKYITSQTVTVPAGGTSRVVDVPIEAASHGDNYNSDPGKDFTVAGYTLEEMRAETVNSIVGGTTRETRTVSQDDYDSAKDILTKRLESAAIASLEELAGTDEIFFEETVQVSVLEEISSAEVGQEADKFDLSISAEISGLFVKKADVESLVTEIVQSQQAIDGNSEINISEFPDIQDIEFVDGIATFNIFTDASAKASITEDTLTSEIGGSSIGEAEEYLSSESDIIDYTINYSPWYMPGFLRKLPDGDGLEIRIVSR